MTFQSDDVRTAVRLNEMRAAGLRQKGRFFEAIIRKEKDQRCLN